MVLSVRAAVLVWMGMGRVRIRPAGRPLQAGVDAQALAHPLFSA